MACLKHTSFHGLFWLLSMILQASFVVHAHTTFIKSDGIACNWYDLYLLGQTKEDRNSRSMMVTTLRASGNIFGSGEGPCFLDPYSKVYCCIKTKKCFKSMVICLANCHTWYNADSGKGNKRHEDVVANHSCNGEKNYPVQKKKSCTS
jgi:hypothetical protein